MKTCYVPNSARDAGREVRLALACGIEATTTPNLLRAWSSIAYLFPGLHPDGFEEAGSGWPPVLSKFAAEVWHRFEVGAVVESDLYPSDAQWAGLYDRMGQHLPQEIERRTILGN